MPQTWHWIITVRLWRKFWGSSVGLLVVCWPLLLHAAPSHALEEVQYHLDVTYDAASHTLAGTMMCTFVWRGPQPVTHVYFFLPPNTLQRRDPREPAAFHDLRYPHGFDAATLTVHQVREVSPDAPAALPFTLEDDHAVPVGRVPDQALLRVMLPRAYNAGERVALSIAFRTHVPRAKNWGHQDGTVALDGLWYPTLVPHREGTWLWGMQAFVYAQYSLRITTAASQRVVASVPWSEQAVHAAQQTLSGSAGPLLHLGLSLCAACHQEEDLTHRPPLRVLVPLADAAEAPRLLQTLRSVLALYQQRFALTLSAPHLTAIVHERDLSWPYSAAVGHLLLVSRDIVRVPWLSHKWPEYIIARGVAQQWWGLGTSYNFQTERWIGEGLATYLATQWLEDTYGRGRTFLAWRSPLLPNFSFWEQQTVLAYRRLVVDNLEESMTKPINTARDRQNLRHIYEKKGALVYAMLQNVLGEETFRAFLRHLAPVGEYLTSQDVRQTAEMVSGKDLRWFFQQWVAERARLDYAVGQVTTSTHLDPDGQTIYVYQIEVRRVGDAIMPLTIRLVGHDHSVQDRQVDGRAQSQIVTWESPVALRDIQLDPEQLLPDISRLNNSYHVPYAIRPLIDFPRVEGYLLYPLTTLDNNFIDGYTPRLHLTAQYLDEQFLSVNIGRKEIPNALSLEAQLLRNRFPVPGMATSVAFTDRESARTLALDTSLLLLESHQQYLTPANLFTLGYHVTFLDRLSVFNGERVPDDFAPSTGRLHSAVLRYRRDTRVPTPVGAPPTVFAEPLAYGHALRLELELASKLLGSNRPDFQQVRWEASEYLRLWTQSWLQLRTFGGWSAGTVPLQRKLSLAGLDAVRGYPYRLELLGDRLVGGTLAWRFPVASDLRLDLPWRYLGVRGIHLSPFVDGAWVWNQGDRLGDVQLRASAGVRLITEFSFVGLLRFEIVADIAYPIDARGKREANGPQVWFRLQSTAGGGLH